MNEALPASEASTVNSFFSLILIWCNPNPLHITCVASDLNRGSDVGAETSDGVSVSNFNGDIGISTEFNLMWIL